MTTVDVGPYRLRFTSERGVSNELPGFDSADDMLKVKSIQKKFRDSWTRPLADQWDIVTSGGTTATVSAGVLTIASGTTAGGFAELLSKESFTIPFRAMVALTSGATRQANNHHIIEAVSVDPITGIPDGKHSMFVDIGGAANATVTNMLYYVQNGGLAPLASAASAIVTTASYSIIELEPFSDECYFHSRTLDATTGRSNSYVRHQQIPDPTAVYKLRIRSMNHQGFRAITNAVAGPGNVIRLTSTAHGYTGNPTVWVEYLTGVTNSGAVVRGNYAATVIDANTLDLTGTVFGGTYTTGSGLVALAAAPAASISLQSQFINCQDYAELTSEITAGRGQTVVGQGLGVVLTGATASSTNIGTVTANVAGQAAHDAVVAGNPVRIAARALTAAYTSVATGDVADLVATLQGVLVTRPWQIPELEWSYASAAGGVVNTTDVVLSAAAGAGLRRYVTSMQLSNNSAVATEIVLKDGATVIWRGHLPANAPMAEIIFTNPIKTTANAALNFACITTGAAVYVNAQGYTAP
jgi:hypothetical protein